MVLGQARAIVRSSYLFSADSFETLAVEFEQMTGVLFGFGDRTSTLKTHS